MITLEQAKTLKPGDILCGASRGSDGNHHRFRVSGQVTTWKRSPERVRVPLKHGLYVYTALTENDLDYVTLAKECDCGND